MINFANLNGLQLWALFAITTCALLIIGGLAVQSWKESNPDFRWDYRNQPDHVVADAPLMAFVFSMLLDMPFVLKEIVTEALKALWKDVLPHFMALLLILTFPISYPVMAYLQRRTCRENALKWKKRNLKARAYV